MSSGNKSQSGTDQWMQQNGATKLANNGTFMTPYGEVLDLGIGYRSGNVTPGWTQTGGQQSYQQGYVPQGLGPSDTTWNGGGGGGGMMDPGMMSAFQQFLMQYQNPQQQQPQKTPTYNRNSPNNRYTMMQSRY
jgi:hypothetical protein